MRKAQTASMFLTAVFAVMLLAMIPGSVRAQEQGESSSDLLVRGGADVFIAEGEQVGTVIILDGDVVVDGRVEDSITVIGGDAIVNGSVHGNVNVFFGSLELSETAQVGGDVSLGSSTFSRAPSASIEGDVDETAIDVLTNWKSGSTHERIWLSLTLVCVVVALVLAHIGGDQVEKVGNNLVRRPLITLGTGTLSIVVLPIVGLFLLTSLYVLPLGIMILSLTPIFWILGYVVTGMMLGRVVLLRVEGLLPVESQNPYAAALIGIFLLQLLVRIPLADMFVIFFAVIVGTGSLFVAGFRPAVVAADHEDGSSVESATGRLDPSLPTGQRRAVTRVLIIWIVNTFALLAIAGFTPLVELNNGRAAFMLAATIGVFNALVRPFILRLTLPLTVLTMGLFVLYVDAVLLRTAELILPGVEEQTFLSAIVTAFLLTITNLVASGLLALNDDDSFYRYTLRRFAGRKRDDEPPSDQSLMIIEIDGLSEPVLRHAIANGYVPTLKRWIDTGTHKLVEFDCGLPAQTSACQAGILYGDNFDIPAFRWYEKESETLMVSNNPRQSVAIDERLKSRSDGLLHPDGVSIGNLVTGGAREAPLTMGAIQARPRAFAREQSSLYFYFLGPYNFTRTLLLMFWEMAFEGWESFQQRRRNIQPRVHRHWPYVLERAISTVLLRDLETAIVLRDVYAGTPISYAMFVGYDVVAHHAGPSSPDALKVLAKIDRRLSMIENAASSAPGEIHFVILSDHGQSTGETFLQRYGESLEDVVKRQAGPSSDVGSAPAGEHEGFNQFNAMLSALIAGDNAAGKAARAALRRRTEDGYVDVTPASEKVDTPDEDAPILVLASGNLGLVYLKNLEGRANIETIEDAYPGLVYGIVNHEGVGFVMVATRDRGPLIIGKRGIYSLDDDGFEGRENPLGPYGPRAAAHFKRLDTFPNVGDIMVNSAIDPETGQVPAFEELVGSHGGVGGDQTRPFLLYPAEWEPVLPSIDSVNDVYTVLAEWKRDLHSISVPLSDAAD